MNKRFTVVVLSMNLSWYVKRAQVIERREWIYRFREQLNLYWLWLCQKKRDNNPARYDPLQYRFFQTDNSLLPELIWDEKNNRDRADLLLCGAWPALGYDWSWQQDSDWHYAPDTGRQWPTQFFSAIATRSDNPYGDIRIVWEPSRLQQLVSLALLVKAGINTEQAVLMFECLLLSWIAANPPYRGVHYVSAMECGLRLIAVCHAVDMIKPYLRQPNAVACAVLKLVDSHATLIFQRLSLYSSAGNHTIAECAGLIYAGELFTELPAAWQWRERGLKLLEREVTRQFFPDGGSIEQSFSYHLFITDLCNLVMRLLEKKGRVSNVLAPVVENAVEFLSALFSDDWQLPNVGDNDGGFALSPHLRISYKTKKVSKTTISKVSTYQSSGYSLIHNSGVDDRLIVFDHGSLGMAPCYGHGHSDCLSVFWREHGEALLFDSGSFTYNGKAKWRSYFRGVTAHNTVSVDHQDQAVERSAFIWSHPFEGRLLKTSEDIDGYRVLLACHNGYLRLGVVHYRALIFTAQGAMLVWDFLSNTGSDVNPHEVSLWWHLGGACVPGAVGHYRVRGNKGACLQIEVQGGDIYDYDGDERGPHGWYSPVYGQKFPITTLETRHSGELEHEFKTYILPGSKTMSQRDKCAFDNVVIKLRSFIS